MNYFQCPGCKHTIQYLEANVSVHTVAIPFVFLPRATALIDKTAGVWLESRDPAFPGSKTGIYA